MATLTPQAFTKRWGESTLSERSSYQQHFLDLCEMLGVPKPAEADPKGEFYTFEKGVEKTGDQLINTRLRAVELERKILETDELERRIAALERENGNRKGGKSWAL